MKRLPAVLLALLLAVPALAAHAHGLNVSLQPEGDGLRGQALYADGTPARGERVELTRQGQTAVLAQAQTDEAGRFRLAPLAAGSYTVTVEGDEGHRAQASAVFAPAGSLEAAALRAELAPLREDLARLERRLRLQDVLGGLGWLVGLAGLYAWWRSQRALAALRAAASSRADAGGDRASG